MVRKLTNTELVQRNKSLEKIVANCRQVEKALKYRAEIETLVSTISSSFINIPIEKVDDLIESSLHAIGEFVGVDRCYVFLFSDDKLSMRNTNEWRRQGIESRIKNFQEISTNALPWWMQKLVCRKNINISRLDDLPPEAIAEKKMLQSQNVKSLVAVPMEYDDKLVGFMGFDSVIEEKFWLKEDIMLLRTVGNIFLSSTKRKETETELIKSVKRFRDLTEMLPEAIFEADKDLNLRYVNKQAFSLFGYSEKEFAGGLKVFDLFVSEDRKTAKENIEKQLRDENPGLIEYRGLRKDGTIFPVYLHLQYFIKDGSVDGFKGIIIDITKCKMMQEALREKEEKLARLKKMESLGLLAGGVAHDLNNVLTGVVSYPELLLTKLPENSEYREPIETIKQSGYRAAAIVEDLLTVARGAAITKHPLNINPIIEDYLHSPEFMKLQQFHPHVKITTDFKSKHPVINGSSLHIRKAIMNLVSNASEAIEGKGKVIVSTMKRSVESLLEGYVDIPIGEYYVLRVSDTGPGISGADFDRIFEPFYTKKKMGRSGTGLGLAVVWSVVQDHDGYIDVRSSENGTIFELYFQVAAGGQSEKPISQPGSDYMGNGETILVVDDFKIQRDITCHMLTISGYQSKAVASGEEAVEYLKKNSVDLILLDMIMDPGINGCETYEKIIKIHPEQKAIIVSGYAETEEVRETQRMGAGQFIRKPFKLDEIKRAIRDEIKK